ncbi:MAG: glycerol-3-phosphate dehydrogenase [Rhodospirillales bacterium]|nr:glycerol-3-phosphate dehydrogenase [Alphaproteobacteria bacterium]MCB1840175.1 glycerol-3-phosphate dehydrogenase [Alphaproteobacteria bacterium]MCB9977767.1 glycerol-3-phosphate dehydrogenase [Rhodospirillales bacterium]
MTNQQYDLCIIGGGINGAGIARDAAGRGLTVVLVEGDDLASGTSSASTKLIHGGLRYLEYFNFKLVKESLRERETLFRTAPHLVHPLEFVLPCDGKGRPLWKIRMGLWLYGRFAGRTRFKPSRFIGNLQSQPFGADLRPDFKKGFVYYDAWGDDTRLVVMNAVDAAENGADIRTRMICTGLKAEEGGWTISLHDRNNQVNASVRASCVINATGPWVRRFLDGTGLSDNDPDLPKVRLVQGSHIILPRINEGRQVYLLQQADKRGVFVIPYEKDFTLIGTTETDYAGDPKDAMATEDEMSYLCEAYNKAFKRPILPEDALFTFSGVRPLLDDSKKDASALSREYRLYHHKRLPAPMISVFGGKLTTYRALAEKAVDLSLDLIKAVADPWTADQPLAGGDFEGKSSKEFFEVQKTKYPWLPEDLLLRYVQTYGARIDMVVGEAQSLRELGEYCGQSVYEAELRYLATHEWAQSVEDVLWRRTKLGLQVTDETAQNIASTLASIVA